jgi:N-acetylglucosaminyl-diphospho-decaprenol L-rhamnosyltransferase
MNGGAELASHGSVDIVIVNWNSGPQLLDCLESISRYGGEHVRQVIVVDNGSTDDSADVDVEVESLSVIKANRNLGFAAACNLGARRGSAHFVLFLNPDACLHPGTLDSVRKFMLGPDGAGVAICGIRLVGDDKKTQRHCARFPTFRTFLGQSTGLQGRPASVFPPFTMQDFDHLSDRDVDQVIGAFFFMRRGVFESLGGFDERFFVYYEEMDLSLRAQQAGWRTRYLAEPTAYHRGGGTTDQVKAKRMFYSLRSRMLYAFKHFRPLTAWSVVMLTLVVEPIGRSGRSLLRRSWKELRESLEGYRLLLSDLPGTLRLAGTMRKGRRQ